MLSRVFFPSVSCCCRCRINAVFLLLLLQNSGTVRMLQQLLLLQLPPILDDAVILVLPPVPEDAGGDAEDAEDKLKTTEKGKTKHKHPKQHAK